MFSSLVFHTRSLGLVSAVLALGGLPQSAVAQWTPQWRSVSEVMKMCVDPEASNSVIVDYLIERDWQFIELDEADLPVPPRDMDAFSPEQIEISRLIFFEIEDGSISLFGPNDEVVAISFSHPIDTRDNLDRHTRTGCSFSALRQFAETDVFNSTLGDPTLYGRQGLRFRAMVGSQVMTADATVLSNIFETEVPALVAFELSLPSS